MRRKTVTTPFSAILLLSREIKNVISTLQEYLSNNGEKCYFLHLFRGTCPPQPYTLIMLWFVNGRTIPTILMFFKSRPITIKDSSAMSTFCSSSSSYLLNVSREEYEPLRQILIDLLLGASIFILVEFCKFSCDFFSSYKSYRNFYVSCQ